MKEFKLEISEEVYLDLESIFQYSIETFGIPKSEEYLYTLHQKIANLSKMPSIGHTHKFLPNDCRVYNIEKHIIIYKIIEEKSIVAILRIMHHKVNIANLFDRDDS